MVSIDDSIESAPVPEGTPADNGGVAQVTPAQESGDAEPWRAEIQKLTTKYEQDISRLKSSLQSAAAAEQKRWEAKEAEYKEQIRKLTLASLKDDDERAEFEYQLHQEKMEELQRNNQMLQEQLQQQQAMNQWWGYFVSQGVSPQDLDFSSLDTLINSGMYAITMNLNQYKKRLEELEKAGHSAPVVPGQQKQEIPATPVINPSGGKPSTSPTWAELISRYGSAETVYELVQRGVLPPSIIPKED